MGASWYSRQRYDTSWYVSGSTTRSGRCVYVNWCLLLKCSQSWRTVFTWCATRKVKMSTASSSSPLVLPLFTFTSVQIHKNAPLKCLPRCTRVCVRMYKSLCSLNNCIDVQSLFCRKDLPTFSSLCSPCIMWNNKQEISINWRQILLLQYFWPNTFAPYTKCWDSEVCDKRSSGKRIEWLDG